MILGVFDELLDRPTGQKLGILGGVLLGVALLDYVYWYGPRGGQLAELRAEVGQKQAELDSKKGKTNSREAVERELRELGAELKRAEARLPDQREIADLLSNVAASGRAAGLDIILFRQKPEVYHDFYAEVPVEMQMRGTYHDVALFLDRVKRLDRIVNVTDIQLKKPVVQGERVMLDAGCTATTFRFLDEAERKRRNEEKKKKEQGGTAAGGREGSL
jgi:type IV pilus assembly protein PilO